MKKLLLLSVCLLTYAGAQAQGLTPKAIPCLEPFIYTNPATPGAYSIERSIASYSCLDFDYSSSPGIYIGEGRTDAVAGKYIHFGPNTHIGSFTGAPYVNEGGGDSLPPQFHAYIGHNDFEVVWFEPNSTPGTVGQYEKLELGVKMPNSIQQKINRFIAQQPDSLNPFNPEEISVQADFYYLDEGCSIGSTPITKTVLGFYYKEYVRNLSTHGWDEDTTSYSFRIRFAPKELGNYLINIKIITADDSLNILPISFKAVPSSNKGYVTNDKTTHDDKRKFLFFSGTGEPFFAVGHDLNWTDTGVVYYQLESEDYYQMANWMNKLANYGGNYTRISMTPYQYGIEWTDGNYNRVNNYSNRMTNAWEFDQILELAKEKGIYINVHGDIHGDFQTEADMISTHSDHHPNTTWDRNPYNDNNQNIIRSIYTPVDFINSEDARKYFKRKLQYIVSRWGYSTNIMIWELVSEIDNMLYQYKIDEGVRQDFHEWFQEMYNYMKNDLTVDQYVSGSYAEDATEDYAHRIFSIADIVLLHGYKIAINENYSVKSADVSSLFFLTGNNPTIYNEHGGTEVLIDCSQYFFHNDTWATAFMGTYGCGQSWNWKHLSLTDRYQDYGPLQDFFGSEYLYTENYAQQKWNSTGAIFDATTEMECYSLVNEDKTKALGYCKNTTYWWTNERSFNYCIDTLLSHHSSKPTDAYTLAYDAACGSGTVHSYTPYVEVQGLKSSALLSEYYQITFYPTEYLGSAPLPIAAATNGLGTLQFVVPDLSNYGDMAFKINYLGHELEMSYIPSDSLNLSIEEIDHDNPKISIYPNPANDMLEITCGTNLKQYYVYTMSGNLVLSKPTGNTNKFSISLVGLERGMYQIKFELLNQQTLVKKFVKE